MELIEKYEEGIHDLEFFSADFKTGSMMIDNKEYPIGYISCCAANISKEKMDRLVIYGGMMKQCYFRMKYFGYDRKEYRDIYAMAKETLGMMKEYRVFDCFDFDGTLKLLEKCFGEKSLDEYEELIFMKEQISKQKIEKPDEKTVFRMVSIEKKMKMAQMIISAFSYAAVDTANFSTIVQNFVDKIMEKDARQKSELAKTAFEFFSDETMMYFFEQSNPSKNDMKGFSISSRQITVPVVIESDGDFVNSGFGLLFGRERATLYLPLLCPPFLCVNWDILRYGAFTILALGRLGWMTLLTAAVIAALFFHSFLSGRRSGRSRLSAAIVATAAAASLIYGWLLVRGLNVYLDGEQGEILHAEVVDTHMPDFRYGANIHRDRFFTVELENGEQLDLFTPDDVHVEKNEGDDVTVALHKGALGIAWAEFV